MTYYYNEIEEAIIRIDGEKTFAKFEDIEGPVKFESNLVQNAIMHGKAITKEQYEQFNGSQFIV